MPRLINRGAVAVPSSASSSTALPEYEPPSCPLNEEARRGLGELANNRGTRVYEAQLKDAVRYLGLSVSDLNERLVAQSDRLDAMRGRRQERGSEKTDEEERLEAHLVDFEGQVDTLTRDAERAVRDVIDKKAELADESAALTELYNAAVSQHVDALAQHRRRLHAAAAAQDGDDGNGNGRDEEHKEPPAASTLDAFRERRTEKLAEYRDQTTPQQRYAQDNDYAGFKKLWHDAAAGADGPPLADASRWFRPNGQPVMDRPGAGRRIISGAAGGDDEGDDDDDDDIAVAREVLSLNCPLTLRPMEEPYSNVKCKHTFEKAAILDYLPARGGNAVQCPQTGCSQTFSRATFDTDFYLDQAILRRVQRARQAQENEDMEDDDDDDDDDGEDMTVRGQRHLRDAELKRERLSMA